MEREIRRRGEGEEEGEEGRERGEKTCRLLKRTPK